MRVYKAKQFYMTFPSGFTVRVFRWNEKLCYPGLKVIIGCGLHRHIEKWGRKVNPSLSNLKTTIAFLKMTGVLIYYRNHLPVSSDWVEESEFWKILHENL